MYVTDSMIVGRTTSAPKSDLRYELDEARYQPAVVAERSKALCIIIVTYIIKQIQGKDFFITF